MPTTWPATTNQVMLFLSFCHSQGYSPSTLSTYCSGISFIHKINGLYDPTNAFIIKKLLEGSKRVNNRTDSRIPIRKQLLAQICLALPSVCSNAYEAKLFHAAFTLAYFGLMRVSELAYTSTLLADRPVLLSDLSFKSNGFMVAIRKSKNSQSGHPTRLVILPADTSEICGIKAMKQFLSVRPQYTGYLFCHQNKKPLTRYQFSCVLKMCINHIGLSSQHYQTHSFRIGRATDLSEAGFGPEKIKQMGRWTSNAYTRYIRA